MRRTIFFEASAQGEPPRTANLESGAGRSSMLIRRILPEDDAAVASIIRQVMCEFDATGPGFSGEDPEVDAMSAAYEEPGSIFYVVVDNEKIVGCGGLAPLAGGASDVCELRKMYLLPSVRGLGVGRVLAETLLVDAARLGYSTVYVETLERMQAACRLYRRLGFQPLDSPLGQTGHYGCDTYLVCKLSPAPEIRIEPASVSDL